MTRTPLVAVETTQHVLVEERIAGQIVDFCDEAIQQVLVDRIKERIKDRIAQQIVDFPVAAIQPVLVERITERVADVDLRVDAR